MIFYRRSLKHPAFMENNKPEEAESWKREPKVTQPGRGSENKGGRVFIGSIKL